MKSLWYAKMAKSTLASLAGVGVPRVEEWAKQGLPIDHEGKVSLFRALQFFTQRYQRSLRQRARFVRLTTSELAEGLGVSRQQVWLWGRRGMKKIQRKDGSYDLPAAMSWLRCHYKREAEIKYQKRVQTLRATLSRRMK